MGNHFKDSLKLSSGAVFEGSVTLNNNVVVRSKTSAAYTNTNTSAAVAAGSVVNLVQYNSSGNLHIGSGPYDNYLSTGSTYINSANNVFYRTRNTGYHQFQINESNVFKIASDGITATKFLTSHGIGTDTPGSNNVGVASAAFNNMSAKQFTLYPSVSNTYGYYKIQTEGTTSATGEARIALGNNVATGTAHNAKGTLFLYGTNTGYTQINAGNNSTSNISVDLPSASGKIPIMVTDADGYWGILPPTGSESTWLRSPKSGIIPYSKYIADSSSLGTASWPWNNVHSKNFKINGVDQAEYGYLKVITEGTTDTTGEGRVMVGNGKATGTAGNGYGRIQMYGTNTGYTMITPGNNSTSNITLTLPSAGGTLARTADNVASATKLNTERTLTIGATGKTFDGSANVSWSLQDIMKGQGLNYDTASNTLYFNNSGTSHKGRLACYNNADYGDYVQLALRTADTSDCYLHLYPDNVTINRRLYINNGGIDLTAGGNIAVNVNKTTNYYALDIHRKCDSGSAGYSTARFGCVNSYGGCACIETRHDGSTVGYVRALSNGGIQIGSGKKLHIQNSAPTANVATGDVWIDAG